MRALPSYAFLHTTKVALLRGRENLTKLAKWERDPERGDYWFCKEERPCERTGRRASGIRWVWVSGSWNEKRTVFPSASGHGGENSASSSLESGESCLPQLFPVSKIAWKLNTVLKSCVTFSYLQTEMLGLLTVFGPCCDLASWSAHKAVWFWVQDLLVPFLVIYLFIY